MIFVRCKTFAYILSTYYDWKCGIFKMTIGEQKALLDRPGQDEETLEVSNALQIGKLAIGALLLGE